MTFLVRVVSSIVDKVGVLVATISTQKSGALVQVPEERYDEDSDIMKSNQALTGSFPQNSVKLVQRER